MSKIIQKWQQIIDFYKHFLNFLFPSYQRITPIRCCLCTNTTFYNIHVLFQNVLHIFIRSNFNCKDFINHLQLIIFYLSSYKYGFFLSLINSLVILFMDQDIFKNIINFPRHVTLILSFGIKFSKSDTHLLRRDPIVAHPRYDRSIGMQVGKW